HQFRHTVATRMINSGVAQHYVQRYLGHETSQMTQHYAHLHDQTLQKAFAKYHGKTVDVEGKVYQPTEKEVESTELQWFRQNIQAQALPNGSCALPTVAHSCPHANACLTCTHFRTSAEHLDGHKKELEQTEKILEKAKENNWKRQIEMNEKVARNLRNIINSLESA
ncbi:MAG: tyrosine-type recombinase/integrase, partial [Merismopedia sp. SIO2A8]|nr:tyrosine-type recombinase/integrase [Merismopedia sp. SIO2A8]